MKQRIYGLETEYAIKHYPKDSPDLKRKLLSEADLFELLGRALRRENIPRLAENKHSTNGYRSALYGYTERVPGDRSGANRDGMFLGNGARFYMDSGGHPEYATPECLSVRDVVIYDKAGERMLEALAQLAEVEMHREGFTGQIFLCKNNVDIRGNTYGCHENYLIERKKSSADEGDFFKSLIKHLMPFLVTRQIFLGAGKVYSGGRLSFQISQRSDFIDEEVSSSTTSKRGIINLKDEPLSVREKYRRLHLILGDSNMSEYMTFLKVGTAGLVLTLIEEGKLTFDLSIAEPVQAIKDISTDPDLTLKIRLRNGLDVTALEIQNEYLRAAKQCKDNSSIKWTDELATVLVEWEKILKALSANDSWSHRAIDWKIKQRILARYLEKEGAKYDELRKWDFFIGKMKDLRLERELLDHLKDDPEAGVEDFLKSKLSQADSIHLRRNLRYLDIDINNYYGVHKIYHGLIERDLRYHDIRRDKGLFYVLRNNGFVQTWGGDSFDEEIERSQLRAPQNTRAKIRGQFIKWMNDNNLEGGVRWDSVYIYGKQLKKIDLPNPFRTSAKKINDIMASYDSTTEI
ncbi:proteasome accessory factor PafA2 family protein [Acidobacteriota bacterium]